MPNIKIGDYVVASKNIEDIEKRSVGVVKEVSNGKITILFIGANKLTKIDVKDVTYLNIKKTGKPYDKKICNVCHLLKNMDEFEINQTDAKGRKTTRPSCRVCRKVINGASLSPEGKKKLDAIKPKGIFTCPVCNKRTIVGVTANLVRDHDHTTGKARAWICDSCNTGLGRFKDDIKFLERVIEYLKKYS